MYLCEKNGCTWEVEFLSLRLLLHSFYKDIKTAYVKPCLLARVGISISYVLSFSHHGRTADAPTPGPQELDGVQFLMHSHLTIFDDRIECEPLYGLASRSIPSLTDWILDALSLLVVLSPRQSGVLFSGRAIFLGVQGLRASILCLAKILLCQTCRLNVDSISGAAVW